MDLSRDLGADVIGDAFEIKHKLGEGLPVMFLPLTNVFETIARFIAHFLEAGIRLLEIGLLAIASGGEFLLESGRGSVARSLAEKLCFGLLLCQ